MFAPTYGEGSSNFYKPSTLVCANVLFHESALRAKVASNLILDLQMLRKLTTFACIWRIESNCHAIQFARI